MLASVHQLLASAPQAPFLRSDGAAVADTGAHISNVQREKNGSAIRSIRSKYAHGQVAGHALDSGTVNSWHFAYCIFLLLQPGEMLLK